MKTNTDWEMSLPLSLHLFLLKVKILVKCVIELIKQNIWQEMQWTCGKGGVLLTLPPPPLSKESQLVQLDTWFRKKDLFKNSPSS